MFDSATRKALLVGVVSSAILLYLVDPFLRFMPSLVLRVVGALSQRWADAIYQDAAQPEPTESLSILTILLLLFILAHLILSPGRPSDKSDPATASQLKRFNIFFISGLFLVGSLLLGFTLIRDTSSSIERCFRYRLSVLTPHLSDRESKDLVASFSLMRSRADYDAIRGRLREYAEKYNVVPVLRSLEATQQGQRRCM